MFRRLLDRFSQPLTNEWRDWEIRRQKMQEEIMDFLLRIVELILICGAIVFVEDKTRSPHYVSAAVAGLVAIYACARATRGMMRLMAEHDLSPRRQRTVYWAIMAFSFLLWIGIQWLTGVVVPLIAHAQGATTS